MIMMIKMIMVDGDDYDGDDYDVKCRIIGTQVNVFHLLLQI